MKRTLRGASAVITLALVLGTGGTALAAPPNITPTPTITAKPAAFVNTTSATFTFTNTNPSATFTCSLDGARATACTTPRTYTGLAVGAHTFSVKAQAPGLKASRSATASWTVDLTAPATPTVTQPASPTKSTSASISFSSASSDVAAYWCSLDDAAFTSCTSPRSLSALAEGAHSFAVNAMDQAGNVSGTKTVSWIVDTSVVTPIISSGPTSPSANAVGFTFGSTDTDVTFSCSMDSTNNNAYSACASGKSYTGLNPGSHIFRVRATDTAGNVSTPAAFTWTVQNAPTIVMSWTDLPGLPLALSKSTSGTFAFSATGHSTLTCRLDGIDQPSCSSPVTVSGLTDGSHTFAVVANAGLPSQVAMTHSWTVDTVAPDAPTLTGPEGRTASTNAEISITSAFGNLVTCDLDGSAVPCGGVATLSDLQDGDHTFTATSSDAAGNTSSAALSWTVDTVGPNAGVETPTALTSPFTVTFDEDVSGVDASSVLLADEAGAPIASSVTCLDNSDTVTDCTNGDVRVVRVAASGRLMLGQLYRVQVNPPGNELVTDDLGNVAPAVDDVVRAPTSAGESSLGAAFTWRLVKDKKAKGGSYVAEHRKGARASWTFTGTAITWYTLTGPAQGKADVFVDGVRKATFNNYAKTVKHGVARTVKGLPKGTHTIEIRVLGKKGAKAGKGTFVAIDGFKVGKKVTASPTLSKVAWQTVSNTSAGGGSYVVADLKGQAMKATARGTSVTLHTVRGPTYGRAAVYVDGALVKTVDLYAKSINWGYDVAIPGLSDAAHTIIVKALGAKNAKSSGTAVAVDGLSVG